MRREIDPFGFKQGDRPALHSASDILGRTRWNNQIVVRLCCRARAHRTTATKTYRFNALCFPLASAIWGTHRLDQLCLCVPYRKISHLFYFIKGKKPYSSTTEFIHNSTFMSSYTEVILNLKTGGSFIP